MDIFITFLPLIVLATGSIIGIIALLIMDKVLYLEARTQLVVASIILLLTMAGGIVAKNYQNTYHSEKDDSYYAEIESLTQNGYTVYINGSAVDFDKIVISDYSKDRIHINDELKEIYISNSN